MRHIISSIIGLFIGISATAQNNIYVSVFGDNTWNGITTATPVRDVQFAINMSQPGDTINIYGGIYYEYLEVTHDQLTIRQASIWDEVIIEPSTGDIVENALLLIDGKFDITIDGLIFANHMYNYAQGIYVRASTDCSTAVRMSLEQMSPSMKSTNRMPIRFIRILRRIGFL